MKQSMVNSSKFWHMLPAFLFLLGISCSSDLVETSESDLNGKVHHEGVLTSSHIDLSLSSDPFALCSTEQSQKAVFETLFLSNDSYRIPGNPNKESLHSFYDDLQKGYFSKNNTLNSPLIQKGYHTFTHAIDVLATTHALLECGGSRFLKDFEQTALLIAAIAHDALHLGVNNQYLINIKHPLVKEFGEDSLQEKRSIDYLLKLIKKHHLFTQSDTSNPEENNQIKRSLKLINEAILYTDFKRHNELMDRMNTKMPSILKVIQGNSEQHINLSSSLDNDTRTLIASFILHTADVSNPGKKWPICERWANLVMAEFFGQGDLEKSLGMKPSMNCDRDSVLIPECQLGFGKYVVHDLYVSLAKIIPEGGNFLLKNLDANRDHWEAMRKK